MGLGWHRLSRWFKFVTFTYHKLCSPTGCGWDEWCIIVVLLPFFNIVMKFKHTNFFSFFSIEPQVSLWELKEDTHRLSVTPPPPPPHTHTHTHYPPSPPPPLYDCQFSFRWFWWTPNCSAKILVYESQVSDNEMQNINLLQTLDTNICVSKLGLNNNHDNGACCFQ